MQFFNPDTLFKKYFPKSFVSFAGEERIGFRGMRNFFSNDYRLQINAKKLLNIGLKVSVQYYEEAKDYYKRIFQAIDEDGSGEIDFQEF